MSSTEAAYTALRDGIVSGEHPGGSRLKEEDLAGVLGLSRTPVREALRRLHAEGLVTVQPRRGALVCTWSADELDEIFELRALVEGYGAKRAATRVTDAQLAHLEDLCDEMDQAAADPGGPDHDRIGELNSELHREVHRAASSRYVAGLLTSLVQMPLVTRTFQRYEPEELARSMGHHRELVAALRARRGEWAEAVMHAHVEAARVTLRRDVEGSSPGRRPPAGRAGAVRPDDGAGHAGRAGHSARAGPGRTVGQDAVGQEAVGQDATGTDAVGQDAAGEELGRGPGGVGWGVLA